jgi:hypothetical protein
MYERTITQDEFQDMCDFAYTHRDEIWRDRDIKNPGLDDRIALLQYVEQQLWDKVIHQPRLLIGDVLKTPADNFYLGIQKKIDEHGDPPFNWRPIVDDMLDRSMAAKNTG